ncbi:ALP1-like protein [Tanacetum coccineum]|uniref:ALP1-like protein n=1 Tax=Tanacetum coccineum TaxID=301880 RepID=A0ABQ4YJ86_9ASTR
MTRRSRTGYLLLLGGAPVSWKTKKQSVVSKSSAEAEYRAMSNAVSEILWMRWLLGELDMAPMAKNCPVSWQGQYGRGDKKYPTIMLEAVASQDLWIWHAFFRVAGANNDINILDNSPLFDDLLNDTAPVVPYVVNGVGYEKGYPFKKRQEGAQKDVERAFGVLQGRWGIIQ